MYIYIRIYTTFLPIHIPKTYLMSAPKSSESEANNWDFPWTWNDAVKLSHEWSWVSLTMSFDGFPPERIWRMGWMIWQSVFLVATNEKWKEDLCINKCSSKMNTWSYVHIYIYIQMLIILRLVQNTHLSHDDLLVEGSKLKRCYYITFCNKNYRHS